MAASPRTSFDTTRIRFGEMIAGVSGLVLFISLFLSWYSVNARVSLLGVSREESQGVSGWQALSLIDILLFLIAIVAVAAAVMRALNAMPRLPITPGLLVLGLGALAVLLVLIRLIWVPHAGDVNDVSGPGFHVGIGRSFGIFIALLAAAGTAVGGWLTWNEEGQPRPGAAGAGAGPLSAGQPGGGFGGGQQQPFATPPQQQQAYSQPPQQQQAQPAATAVQQPQQQQPAQTAGQAKADWYPDPRGEKRLRYYDGTQWTEHTAD